MKCYTFIVLNFTASQQYIYTYFYNSNEMKVDSSSDIEGVLHPFLQKSNKHRPFKCINKIFQQTYVPVSNNSVKFKTN